MSICGIVSKSFLWIKQINLFSNLNSLYLSFDYDRDNLLKLEHDESLATSFINNSKLLQNITNLELRFQDSGEFQKFIYSVISTMIRQKHLLQNGLN